MTQTIESSKEELILSTVKQALTAVIKDTATQPGMIHPLSEITIDRLRNCLMLISEREKELAAQTGRSMDQRPHFTDERKPAADVVIPISSIGRPNKN
ncbi:MAG: segregation and condensation protein A [Gammaproteobacteria bacterium]